MRPMKRMMDDGGFDRDGKPITTEEWSRLHSDRAYVQVARTEIAEPLVYVSTVWLGLNHRYTPGPPLTFETMVFRDWAKEYRDLGALVGVSEPPMLELDVARYSTEAEALAGHEAMVNKWRGRELPPPEPDDILA